MGRLRSSGLQLVLAIIFLWSISGCGGHRPPGQSTFAAKINLNPTLSASVQVGSTFNFSASAQNSSNTNISATFIFASSDTSIVNIAPNGVACAGVWDAAFTTCTGGKIGVAEVTASAFGNTSAPTFVFVHPPIDNISVTGILPPNGTVQEPCLSQTQSMTLQAQAFSQGVDVTSSVGPFTWSANNPSVVTLTPVINLAYNLATNQETATALNPGITNIIASASGVSSTSFQQPNLGSSPPLIIFDFFETCPIQNITLEVGHAGSEQNTFVSAKGTSETVVATVTDVMGNSSLPNTANGVVLTKIPLTWTASQPAVIATTNGCTESCTITTPSVGSGSITASCTPPTCNIGFPYIPVAFATPVSLASCTQYLHPFFPKITSCQQFIPLPVYSSPPPNDTTGAVSGIITGNPGTTSLLAGSLGCADTPPSICGTGLYSISTGHAVAGTAIPMPDAPNSLLFDPAGDKVYMGSQFGAQIINPANLGTANSAFTSLGTVTGTILAVSPNGNFAIFSDTVHTPNQVYVVNEANSTSPAVTPLSISAASAAAFSRDNSQAFIFGLDGNNNPTLFVYSILQALQAIPLPPQTTVNSIAFSTNSAFAYLVEPSLGGAGPAVSVFNTCTNPVSPISVQPDIPLASTPLVFRALPDGMHFIALESNGNLEYITASMTGIPVATITTPATSICPMTVTHTIQPINLDQGVIHPFNFFVSADGSLLYIIASDRGSILVYDLSLGTVTSGIELIGSSNGNGTVTPIAADISADSDTIMVVGSDGLLHQISTGLGGADLFQINFPFLANYSNSFCTYTPAAGPCTLDFVAVKP